MSGHVLWCYNATPKVDELNSEDGPSQGLIELVSVRRNNVLEGVKPTQSGRLNLAVMPLGIGGEATGKIYLHGQRRVSIVLADGESLYRYADDTRRGRVGSKQRSWYGQVDSLGPLFVEEVYDENGDAADSVTNATGADMTVSALCTFGRRRGGAVYVRNHGTSTVHLPAEVLIFGSAYTVTEYEFAKVRIDAA